MPEYLYLLTILLPLVTVLLIFGFKYGSAAYQSRARVASDTAYRELAQITTRLAAVVKILQEVE